MSEEELFCKNIVAISIDEEKSISQPCYELNCSWLELKSRILQKDEVATRTCCNWLDRSPESILLYKKTGLA